MIISRTPYRVSLFGGGSDYPTWFRENRGAGRGFAINKYCYISLRRLPPLHQRLSMQYLKNHWHQRKPHLQ